MRLLWILLSTLVLAIGNASAQQAAPRLALIVANANYPDADAPLKEPLQDARALAEELRRDGVGFDVDIAENLSKETMRKTFDRFFGKIKPGSVALVFFSGYAIQSIRQSYIIPIDGQIWTESDVRRDGVSLDTILREMNTRGARVKIAILDASRRTPFERRFRPASTGLAPVDAPTGSLVMYSSAPSTVVSDSGGEQRLFVNELVAQLREPQLTAEEAFNRTRMGVSRGSQGQQVPWLSSSLGSDFSFALNPGSKVASAPPAPPPPPASSARPAAPAAAPSPRPVATPKSDPVPPSQPAPPPATSPAPPGPVASLPPPPTAAPPPAPAAPPPVAAAPPTPPPVSAAPPTPAAPPPVSAAPLPPAAPPPVSAAPPAPAAPPPMAALPPSPSLSPAPAARPPAPDAPPPAAAVPPPLPIPPADMAAIQDLNRKLSANPKDTNALYRRGQLYAKNEDFPRAVVDFDAMIQLNPKDSEALNNRCWVRAMLGDLQAALQDCDASLQVKADNADTLDSRGFVKLKLSQAQAAIADYDAALKLSAKKASSLYGRGIAKLRAGNASGNNDIAAAKAIDPGVADEFDRYGVR